MAQSLQQADPTSKLVLELWSTNVDHLDDDAGQGTMQDQAVEGKHVLEVSGEEIPSLELADQIAVRRHVPGHRAKFSISQHQFNIHVNIRTATTV